MRHHNKNKKFGRVAKQRKSLMRSLCISLIEKGKLTTTQTKAKSLRPIVEKLITKAKNGGNTVSVKRLLTASVGLNTSKKLVDVLGPKYKSVNGGYTRITKLEARKSDGSDMAVIELI